MVLIVHLKQIYFVNTKNFTESEMGTKNPLCCGCEFGPVRLRAFGTLHKGNEASKFIKRLPNTAHFTTEEISEQLRNLIVTRFTDVVGEANSLLDLAANYEELAKFIVVKISPEFNEYGLEVTKFLVENISLPSEVEQMLDKRSSMGILGNLNQYAQFQAANAMEAAAKNPNGNASSGIEMGMGFAMAQKMGEAFNQKEQPPQGPPPIPAASSIMLL